MTEPLRIEKLRRDHAVAGFDCGQEALNRFLIRFALTNQQAGAAQTYVALAGDTVVGYDSLIVGEVAFDAAPQRLTKGLAGPSGPVPRPVGATRLRRPGPMAPRHEAVSRSPPPGTMRVS